MTPISQLLVRLRLAKCQNNLSRVLVNQCPHRHQVYLVNKSLPQDGWRIKTSMKFPRELVLRVNLSTLIRQSIRLVSRSAPTDQLAAKEPVAALLSKQATPGASDPNSLHVHCHHGMSW